MAKLTFFVTLFCLSTVALAQKRISVELSLYSRYDIHADYVTRYGDRSYTDTIVLSGTSVGIRGSLLLPAGKRFKLKLGAGYNRLGINEIERKSPWGPNVPDRTIDYTHPTGIQPLFHTDNYHYDNIDLSAGIFYLHQLKNDLVITAGAEYNYYHTFSQRYRITYDNSKYTTTDSRPLGFGVNAQLGILTKLKTKKYYIHPAILIPVYQELNGDKVFLEDKHIRMKKELSGVGISVSFGKYF